jgi:hypothetical protein
LGINKGEIGGIDEIAAHHVLPSLRQFGIPSSLDPGSTPMHRRLRYALIVAVATGVAVDAATLKKTWKSPDAAMVSFAGKKVAALVISHDTGLRISAEEALARQLVAIGVEAIAAYRVFPRELTQEKAKAKAWAEQVGIDGVVAMRLVSAETVTSYDPVIWSSGYYSSFWTYYDYTTGAMWSPGSVHEDSIVTVETVVFSVPRDRPVWASLSETTNPSGMDAFMKDLVTKTVSAMKKEGLTAKPRK